MKALESWTVRISTIVHSSSWGRGHFFKSLNLHVLFDIF